MMMRLKIKSMYPRKSKTDMMPLPIEVPGPAWCLG